MTRNTIRNEPTAAAKFRTQSLKGEERTAEHNASEASVLINVEQAVAEKLTSHKKAQQAQKEEQSKKKLTVSIPTAAAGGGGERPTEDKLAEEFKASQQQSQAAAIYLDGRWSPAKLGGSESFFSRIGLTQAPSGSHEMSGVEKAANALRELPAVEISVLKNVLAEQAHVDQELAKITKRIESLIDYKLKLELAERVSESTLLNLGVDKKALLTELVLVKEQVEILNKYLKDEDVFKTKRQEFREQKQAQIKALLEKPFAEFLISSQATTFIDAYLAQRFSQIDAQHQNEKKRLEAKATLLLELRQDPKVKEQLVQIRRLTSVTGFQIIRDAIARDAYDSTSGKILAKITQTPDDVTLQDLEVLKLELNKEPQFTSNQAVADFSKQVEQYSTIISQLREAEINSIRQLDAIESAESQEKIQAVSEKIKSINLILSSTIRNQKIIEQKTLIGHQTSAAIDLKAVTEENEIHHRKQLIELQKLVYQENQRIEKVTQILQELEQKNLGERFSNWLKEQLSSDAPAINFAQLSFDRQLALHGIESKNTFNGDFDALRALIGDSAQKAYLGLASAQSLLPTASGVKDSMLELGNVLVRFAQQHPEMAEEFSGNIEHILGIIKGQWGVEIAWNRGTTQNKVRDALLGTRKSLAGVKNTEALPVEFLAAILIAGRLPELIRVGQAVSKSADSTWTGVIVKMGVGSIPLVGQFVAEGAGRAANAAVAYFQTKAERQAAYIVTQNRNTEVVFNAGLEAIQAARQGASVTEVAKTFGMSALKRQVLQSSGTLFRDTYEGGISAWFSRKYDEFKIWREESSNSEKLARAGAIAAGAFIGIGIAAATVFTAGLAPLAAGLIFGIAGLAAGGVGGVAANMGASLLYPDTTEKIEKKMLGIRLNSMQVQLENDNKIKEISSKLGKINQKQPANDIKNMLAQELKQEAMKLITATPQKTTEYLSQSPEDREAWLRTQLSDQLKTEQNDELEALATAAEQKASTVPGCPVLNHQAWLAEMQSIQEGFDQYFGLGSPTP